MFTFVQPKIESVTQVNKNKRILINQVYQDNLLDILASASHNSANNVLGSRTFCTQPLMLKWGAGIYHLGENLFDF